MRTLPRAVDGNDAAVTVTAIHVLIVDDEADMEALFRQRFRRELRSGELILQFAETGRAALDVLETRDPDVVLIFTDIEMPEMNGIELLKRVREKRPDVRVYLVTAYDSPFYTQQAKDLGAHGYLTKPLDFSALRQVMFAI
ncbi:response regulator transcription factor [Mycobacterium shinjukuense]|uniref:Two-component response regulator n=1 Tax=Mycobacterium shinjukuense TaxID=398694 RepID=A0A7I7MWB0_9MYCO|nr:response regulator [Mycobacterium shinjukuense]BBX76182.1 two-component response regulator [Mycobacterium shinjukuense]